MIIIIPLLQYFWNLNFPKHFLQKKPLHLAIKEVLLYYPKLLFHI